MGMNRPTPPNWLPKSSTDSEAYADRFRGDFDRPSQAL